MRSFLLKGSAVTLFSLAFSPVNAQILADAQPISNFIRGGGFGAQAVVNAYNNTTTFSSAGFSSGASAVVSGNTLSRVIADDITFAPGFAGQSITELAFSTANFNAAAVSARPFLRFYLPDGTGSAPGTFLGGINLNPVTLNASGVQIFTLTNITGLTVPAGGTFWAGLGFDNNSGATGATATQISNLGVGLFNPPTVGSSADVIFRTTNGGSFASNNPAGSLLFFNGNPRANAGWRFGVTVVPEPGSIALLVGLGISGLALRRRRK